MNTSVLFSQFRNQEVSWYHVYSIFCQEPSFCKASAESNSSCLHTLIFDFFYTLPKPTDTIYEGLIFFKQFWFNDKRNYMYSFFSIVKHSTRVNIFVKYTKSTWPGMDGFFFLKVKLVQIQFLVYLCNYLIYSLFGVVYKWINSRSTYPILQTTYKKILFSRINEIFSISSYIHFCDWLNLLYS